MIVYKSNGSAITHIVELFYYKKQINNEFKIIFQTGHTALQRAAAEGHLEVVKHLIGRGAPVDHQDDVVSQNDK